jgi:hypothetical protein
MTWGPAYTESTFQPETHEEAKGTGHDASFAGNWIGLDSAKPGSHWLLRRSVLLRAGAWGEAEAIAGRGEPGHGCRLQRRTLIGREPIPLIKSRGSLG